LSEAVAVTTTVPEMLAPPMGAVTETVGGVVSADPVPDAALVNVPSALTAALPLASVDRTR
jgi:hypothetical protein